MPLTEAQIDANCTKPGTEGVMWRCVKHFNPDGLEGWLKEEQLRGTDVDHLARALASVLAGAAMGFATNCNDTRGALLGGSETRGVVHHFQTALQAKVSRHVERKSPGGVFLPPDDVGGGP